LNRLWVRLTLAFALVVLVAVTAIGLLADLTAGQAFREYLSYTDIARFQNLTDLLSQYYETQGNWDGVDTILQQVRIVSSNMPPPIMGRYPGTLAWRDEQYEIILADFKGHVVYAGADGDVGRRMSRDERAAAQEITASGEVVGLVVVARPVQSAILGPLEQSFVMRLRWLLVVGALLAVGLGLLLGLAISRNLTAPLQRLAGAARAVANRDFSRRVDVEGSAEIAEVARAFNEMTSKLEMSEGQRQNMVADVAHELRTPISVIQGNLRAILDDVYPLDKAEISRLYDETRLLSRLVDDLRELALADAGQLRLHMRPVDAGQVIEGTLDNLSLAAEAHEIELSAQLPDDLPSVQADADRLAQVLRNLLLNALQHTPRGGSVSVSGRQTGDHVEIAVADTGEGIAASDLRRVFDRFWRADRARARGEGWNGSTGLGLSIAQSLVAAQGGRIWAASTPGEGSTFYFTLPVAPG
jgi:two-component system OmpR family sensor kinase